MPIARCLRVLLTAACLLLAIPALASAATYTVNSTLDEEDASSGAGVCETSIPGECTLRAALETSNASTGVEDEIKFSATFDGEAVDTIVPFIGTLPVIADPVVINGTSAGPCDTELGPEGPCVGLDGGGLKVEADGVTIRGIAITGTERAINVFNGSTGFVAEGNWLGIELDGEFGSGTPSGIYVGPESDGALIGDDTLAERNVFGHSETFGLWINGASNTVVRGNYFGVEPDGTTEASNGRNIVVTDNGADKAENTEIGEKIEEAGGPTAACDEGCNVIAAAQGEDGPGPEGTGIDLVSLGGGGDPATGPTEIHGNYIGLDATGLGVLPNDKIGIEAGSSGEVEIGGPEAGDANYFAGGTVGVNMASGVAPEVIGNAFGIDGEGNSVTPPSGAGIISSSAGFTDPEDGALIAGNVLRMVGGTGIQHEDLGAEITDNYVEGAMLGIRTIGTGPAANVIEGNEVIEAEDIGILVNNEDNTIAGNEVIGSGESGIVVDPEDAIDVSGNVIGGDSEDAENLISESGTAAIEIVGLEASRNEMRRNRGQENDFRFLRLVAYGGGEDDPNGIKEPKEVTAAKTEASGTGAPGATVRVFWKATTEEGEIAGFLAQATVDGSGKWKATYAPQPGETKIIATQTLNGGTSDLSSLATTPPDPPAPPSGCPAVPSACPPPPPPPPDTTKPKVTIKKAPKAKSTNTTAKFVFSANEAGSKFKCKLDKKAFANCQSPKTYKKLKPGKHTFKVKATDAAGNVSAVVTRKFTVLPPG